MTDKIISKVPINTANLTYDTYQLFDPNHLHFDIAKICRTDVTKEKPDKPNEKSDETKYESKDETEKISNKPNISFGKSQSDSQLEVFKNPQSDSQLNMGKLRVVKILKNKDIVYKQCYTKEEIKSFEYYYEVRDINDYIEFTNFYKSITLNFTLKVVTTLYRIS